MSNAVFASGPVRPQGQKQSTKIVAAVLGNAMEIYDFSVYAAFAAVIGRMFFPATDANVSLLLSVATFGVGFVARPLGGVVIGAFADRYGRKRAMSLTIWMMALGSGVIGLLPTYDQIGYDAPALLVAARLIQGFSAGGEVGPATTFLLESAPPDRQGLFGSWQLASQNIGNIISGLVGVTIAFALSKTDADGWGWRIPFLLGILIAPLGVYIRRSLVETLDQDKALGSMSAVLSNLFKYDWKTIALTIMVFTGVTVTQWFFIYGTTYAITTLGYSQGVGMSVTLVIGISGMLFSLLGGLLADRYGLKPVSLIARVAITILLYPAMKFVLAQNDPVVFLVVIAALMALQAISGATAIIMMPKAFPASVRTAGMSISYAVGVALFGGTAQIVFTWIIGATGDKLSWIFYIVAMNVVSLVGTLILRLPATAAKHEPVSEAPILATS